MFSMFCLWTVPNFVENPAVYVFGLIQTKTELSVKYKSWVTTHSSKTAIVVEMGLFRSCKSCFSSSSTSVKPLSSLILTSGNFAAVKKIHWLYTAITTTKLWWRCQIQRQWRRRQKQRCRQEKETYYFAGQRRVTSSRHLSDFHHGWHKPCQRIVPNTAGRNKWWKKLYVFS